MGTCTIQTDRSSMMALKQRLKTAEIRKTPPYAIYGRVEVVSLPLMSPASSYFREMAPRNVQR